MYKVTECSDCRLHLSRNKIVNGTGSPYSSVLFVGEAPGSEEDTLGKPFIGPAGKTATALMYSAGFQRSNVYITNVVRCRPPNNRPPQEDEILACKKHLVQEIKEVDPKYIIAFGETASKTLVDKWKGWRGMSLPALPEFGSRQVTITYHPSYVYRTRRIGSDAKNISLFSLVAWDIKKGTRPQKEHQPVYETNPSPERVTELLFSEWKDSWTAVDIETVPGLTNPGIKKGLDPFYDEVIGISFCGEPGIAFHLGGSTLEASWKVIKTFLETHSKLIYQNNLFDRYFLQIKKGIHSKLAYDTQTGIKLIYAGSMADLNYLRSLYTNIPPYKQKYKVRGKVNHLTSTDLSFYNNLDTDTTLQVYQGQKKYVSEKLMSRLVALDEVALQMKIRGVQVDQNQIAYHYALLQPTRDRMIRNFEEEYKTNPASSKQLAELLFDQLKLPKIRKRSTDKEVLKELKNRAMENTPARDVIDKLFKIRDLAKQASVYCEGLYNLITPDGRVHPNWLPTGTDTGRWSCTQPNMQNFPKDMRDVITASKGKKLIGADYSKIQVWAVAILAEDQKLIDLLSSGVDIHNEVLKAIEEKYPLTKTVGPVQARLRAKAVVFGTFFGRTPKSISLEFNVDPKIAKLWQEQFFYRFPKLDEFFKKVLNSWEKKGYVEGIYGRRKYTTKATEAKNHPIQNFEAEVVGNAMLTLASEGFDLILNVHDQLVCEVDKTIAEDRFKRLCEIMETSSQDLYARFPVEGHIVDNWKEV